MAIHLLVPEDTRSDNIWILYEFDNKGRLVIKKAYKDIQCPSCKRVNEDRAFERGLEKIKLRCSVDFLSTNDNFLLVSKKMKNFLEKNASKSFSYKAATVDCSFFFAWPNFIVEADKKLSGTRFSKRQCKTCKRYKEAYTPPLLRSMRLPKRRDVIFSSSIRIETPYACDHCIYVTDDLSEKIKKSKLKGVFLFELGGSPI